MDDDEEFCQLLEMILKEYPTRIFTTLKSVKEALTRELPEILLLDLIFGRQEHAGVEYLENLHRCHSSVLVIVVSASKNQRDNFRTGQLQAFEYVEKGVPGQSFHEELLRVVREAEKHCTVNHVLSQLFELPDLIQAFTGRPVEKCDPVVRLVLQCFLSSISAIGPSVAAIAEKVGMSTSTIREHFRKQFGSGPSETLTDIAVLIAGSLIMGGFKVAEAAVVVGMSPERLRQRFQAAFECSPRYAHEIDIFRDIHRTNWLYNNATAIRYREITSGSQAASK